MSITEMRSGSSGACVLLGSPSTVLLRTCRQLMKNFSLGFGYFVELMSVKTISEASLLS